MSKRLGMENLLEELQWCSDEGNSGPRSWQAINRSIEHIRALEAERDALRNSRLTDGERWTLMAAAILLDNAGCDETADELRAISAKEPK